MIHFLVSLRATRSNLFLGIASSLSLLAMTLVSAGSAQAADDGTIKQPNVAGAFYSADPEELGIQVERLMGQAKFASLPEKISIAIAPHAGYVYSGSIAAYTYKALSSYSQHYSTVILIAPSHFYPFNGAAIWPKGGFQTPLGVLSIDEQFAQDLMKETAVVQSLPQAFDKEHAVEVQLPFVQTTFGHAVKIVPILMGQPDFKICEELAMALHKLIGQRKDVLVLVSSDFSHYFPYDTANEMDAGTLAAIKAGDIEGFWKNNLTREMEMCGFVPVTVGMMLAKLWGETNAYVLKYANSGDTAGDKVKVVGYGAIVFKQPMTAAITAAQKQSLLSLARHAITTFVKTGQKVGVKIDDARLSQVQGTFVTITKNGQLRGCIGDIIGHQPLILTVRDMAIAVASQDPRFPAVSADELKDIHVEISLLSVPRKVKYAGEIVMGRDGVIISDGRDHQGVFLPQVAVETGWSKDEFLSELCSQKASLPRDCWKSSENAMYTFTAEVFGE